VLSWRASPDQATSLNRPRGAAGSPSTQEPSGEFPRSNSDDNNIASARMKEHLRERASSVLTADLHDQHWQLFRRAANITLPPWPEVQPTPVDCGAPV
jgi:hypothetical protein